MKLAYLGREKTKDRWQFQSNRRAAVKWCALSSLQALGWRAWNEGAPPVARRRRPRRGVCEVRPVCVMHDPDAPLFGSYSQLLLHSRMVTKALTL